MAIIKQCDKCKTIVGVDALITIKRIRKCFNQHDGEYCASIQADYDLCEKCAREIELLLAEKELVDAVIPT